jgi:hypothetical protein
MSLLLLYSGIVYVYVVLHVNMLDDTLLNVTADFVMRFNLSATLVHAGQTCIHMPPFVFLLQLILSAVIFLLFLHCSWSKRLGCVGHIIYLGQSFRFLQF